MRYWPIFFLLGLTACLGCADRPEISAAKMGSVVNELPYLEEAAKPFPFPYGGDNDHQNCVFNEDDLF